MNRVLLFSLSLLLVYSCSSPKMLSDATNVSGQKVKYNKILIVAKAQNEATRASFEKTVVDDLQAKGVSAVSSLTYGLTVNEQPDEAKMQEVKTKLEKEGFDGVIVTSLVSSKSYDEVIPGHSSVNYNHATYHGVFTTYYAYYPSSSWEPDQLVSGKKYILESSLFKIDQPGNNLQWTGRFIADEKQSIDYSIQTYAKEMVGDLMKESIMK